MKNHSQFNEGKNELFGIEFHLRRKDIKNLIIRLNSKNEIIVSVPRKITDKIILDFLTKNLEKFNNHSLNRNSSINIEEKYFYLFGEKIFFQIDNENQKIIINDKKHSIKSKPIEEAINSYRKKQLHTYLIIKQLQMQKIMNIPEHKIYVRSKEGAWATNHTIKKDIYYSTNLSSFSKDIIDYVIIHELSHNKYPNHSKEFWNLVAKYDSNFKTKRLKLKKTIYS